MLEVQKYLKTKSLNDLSKEHGVYARFSTKNPKKVSLNYDQIEAISGVRLVEECRGLVLESGITSLNEVVGDTKILAYPFDRFYNEEDPNAADIDWTSSKVFEKKDGSLCIVYHDPTLGEWCCATRSVPDADTPYETVTNKTFSDLFKQATEATYGISWENFCQSKLSNELTYMFELCTPENIVVVCHEDYRTWLLGVRNNANLTEIKPEYLSGLFRVCPSHNLSTISPDDLKKFVSSRDPLKHEGVVVRDDNFNRLKIKDPKYNRYNSLRDRLIKSPRAMLEVILNETEDDAKHLLVPEMRLKLESTKESLSKWIKEETDFIIHNIPVDEIYRNPKERNDIRKRFVFEVQKNKRCLSLQMHVFTLYTKEVDNKKVFSTPKEATKDWINHNKNDDGTYPNSFLDQILKQITTENKS